MHHACFTRKRNNHHHVGSSSLRRIGMATLIAFSPMTHAWEIIDLGTDVIPLDINNNGSIVGYRVNGTAREAVRIPLGGSLEVISGAIQANGANDSEWVSGNTASGAFVDDGSFDDIGDGHTAGDINAGNLVAGTTVGKNPYRSIPLPVNPAIYDANRRKWNTLDVARVYSRGTRQGIYADIYRLNDINDAGYAVGSKSRYGLVGSSVFVTTPAFDSVRFLPASSGGYGAAINNDNMVAGTSGDRIAFTYDLDTDTYQELGTLDGGLSSYARDINGAGTVVGTAYIDTASSSAVAPELYRAFLWNPTDGTMIDINSLAGLPGWLLTDATAINDQGDVVGTALVSGMSHGYLLTQSVTPPPVDNNLAPVADMAVSDNRVRAGTIITFDASGSSDADGSLVDYAWDFGDGSTATGAVVTHRFSSTGTFTVSLTVTDDQGDTDTVQVDIRVRRNR